MVKTNYVLFLLVLLAIPSSAVMAQKAGKTNEQKTSLHPMADRFDLWRQRAGSTPQLEEFIDRLNAQAAHTAPAHSSRAEAGKFRLPSIAGKTMLDGLVAYPEIGQGKYGQASLLTAANGDLLMVYLDFGIPSENDFPSAIVPPELYFVRSTDGGDTWSDPVAIRGDGDISLDFRGPMLRETGGGRLLVFDNNPWDPDMMSYSDDGGLTWQDGPRDDEWSDRFHQIDGEIWHTYVDFDAGAFVYRTSADGVTWSDQMTLMTYNPETTDIFLSSVAKVGESTLVGHFIRFINNPCCSQDAAVRISTDMGATWGAFIPLPFPDGVSAFDGQMKMAADGTLWAVSAAFKDDGSIGDQIFFQSSDDGGQTWTTATQFTSWIGGNYWPDIAFTDAGPVISFQSSRFVPTSDINVWFGLAGDASVVDASPPPYVDFDFETPFPSWTRQNTPENVAFRAADEGSIQSAELVVEVGDQTTRVPLLDNGVSPDQTAGDGIYVGTIPGLPFGERAYYHAEVQDNDGQPGYSWAQTLDRLPVTDNGEAIFVVGLDGSFGRNAGFRFPAEAAGQWPGHDGYNYLNYAGLFVGRRFPAPAKVMHSFYDGIADWQPKEGVYPSASSDVSDSDFTLVFDDSQSPYSLGLEVQNSIYQWSSGLESNGLVFSYDIRNTTGQDIAGVVTSMWMDPDIYLEHADAEYEAATDDKVGLDTDRWILYMYDSGAACANNADFECTDGHIGMMLLEAGTSGKRAGIKPQTAARWTQETEPYRNANSDASFYTLMTKGIDTGLSGGFVPPSADHRILMSAEPFDLAAGSDQVVAFAVVFGHSKEDLGANADAIAAAYASATVANEDVAPGEQPQVFSLGQNYPNPFNPSTIIPFAVPESGHVIVRVSDVLGRQVATLVNDRLSAGSHTVTFAAGDLPSGTYFYTLEAGGKVQTKKLFLLK